MEQKFQTFKEFVVKQGFSIKELEEFVYELKFEAEEKVIETSLPIAYLNDGIIIVKSGLYLNHLNELWGVRFSNGVFVACRPIYNVCWNDAKELAASLQYNGKTGSLPSIKQLKEVVKRERADYMDVCFRLKQMGENCKTVMGDIWSCSQTETSRLFCKTINFLGSVFEHAKNRSLSISRLAVVF